MALLWSKGLFKQGYDKKNAYKLFFFFFFFFFYRYDNMVLYLFIIN